MVPVWHASPKLEVGARTLRTKLAKLYAEFLVPFPSLPSSFVPLGADQRTAMPPPPDWEGVLTSALSRGSAVPEVAWAIPGEVRKNVVSLLVAAALIAASRWPFHSQKVLDRKHFTRPMP